MITQMLHMFLFFTCIWELAINNKSSDDIKSNLTPIKSHGHLISSPRQPVGGCIIIMHFFSRELGLEEVTCPRTESRQVEALRPNAHLLNLHIV